MDAPPEVGRHCRGSGIDHHHDTCLSQARVGIHAPLEEGSILYMPTTMPGISITEAQKILQVTRPDHQAVPEVDRVLGKAGRAETSTDPAPLSMLETVITLKPSRSGAVRPPGTRRGPGMA